ncbi:MAG: hypothetical protein A3C93_03305 [Candidatus Lloydbacteria bacterium RIFCSPHIGHO2_02_FULL_54_17]|uniref:Addiction module toxin RelE n=1 Tax=Candidatus Lloydbacteria bacterium RIFCSPHIGHO2_02_FULL_54_17 TaxID=1798664 RepID=A0A1G2DFJ4_9BACT|nr:MAG: hypothetical protein A2762_04045 [Candidatus Lloydbacteria bacterium RIFCSPHIGHO2_01_FULL_54_11]OGZ12313.1 MAG: hypothetical protein A3C93_03305 [Candidatus Lloydbacteria bacterium RIFCSPHIGHO2_02_FULL_54_17]OGZ14593.1 MAG: hypothetical protein A2948_05815 [Candidatus Lloydbacteria bacterium RIFCSPLOWO2_01_FULL_54_18]OGZ16320.1 MAG: hypothetical protein A3H76_06565 [Candidatus Lloydbacteria bacterium RIFCSPLOWO2_02_FULL_54_12]
MYLLRYSKDFSRSLRRHIASGKFSMSEFERTVDLLRAGDPLPPKYRDHALTGEYVGCRECHIRGNLLLIYEKHDDVLVLVMIDVGTHHELFGL